MTKKIISVFLCITLLLSVWGTAAFAADALYVVKEKNGASMYVLPSEVSTKLTTIKYNTVLTVAQENSGYIKTTYNGYSGWVPISALKVYGGNTGISGLVITSLPDKTVYYEDDPFIADGLTVAAVNQNGVRSQISGYTLDIPDMYSLGKKNVAVSYLGSTAIFEIEVIRQPIDHIEITTPPDSTTVIEDSDAPDLTGMTVTAYYTDGRAPQTVTEYTVSGFDSATLGAQTITISYKYPDITASLDVNIVPKTITGITITEPAQKTVYYEDGLTPDIRGLVLSAEYDNGKSETVTPEKAEFTAAPVIGENTISVSYAGFSAAYTVTVEPLEIIGLEVIPPDTVNYPKGSEADLSGLIVLIVYNSGNKENTFAYDVDIIDTSVYGEQTVNVYYDNYSAPFKIKIVSTYSPGDINRDGKVTSADARLALRYSALLMRLDEEQIVLGDIDGNGKVSSADARKILRHAARIELLPGYDT
ncbi:MAG: bacterial Ig-like domain-containing protein [Clostridia bacterium]|nr:bacterial Ig-like domain-containing protein [Clostridia bacterium]